MTEDTATKTPDLSEFDVVNAEDELDAAARKRAESAGLTPEDWGAGPVLPEVGQRFKGRFRGETTDPDNTDDDGKPKRVFLLWDKYGEPCWTRSWVGLAREMDREKPDVGNHISIHRAKDYQGKNGAGYQFGVAAMPCGDPLPGAVDDDDVPF